METHKILNHVKTRLLIWGDPFSSDTEDTIVCISGNPGIIDFYHNFGTELHKNTNMPVCVIGHAGHDIIADEKSYSLKDEGHLFDLKGQLEHKLDLINNNISKQSRLHLTGHSIGAWMIIELLQKDPTLAERVASINLLFPTLQGMAATQSGYIVNNIIRRVHVLVMFLLMLFNMLPNSFLFMLASVYIKCKSLKSNLSNSIFKCLNSTILERVLYLAYDEIDKVTNLNIEAIDKIKHKVSVIYATEDSWVPLKYMEDLRQFQPPLQMTEVCYSHAFVLKSSENVAEMVSKNIKKVH